MQAKNSLLRAVLGVAEAMMNMMKMNRVVSTTTKIIV